MEPGQYCVTITHHESGCVTEDCFELAPEGQQDVYPIVREVTISKEGGGVLIYVGRWLNASYDCLFYQGGMKDLTESQVQTMINGQMSWDVEVIFNKPMANATVAFPGLGSVINLSIDQNVGTRTLQANQVAAIVSHLSSTNSSEALNILGTDLQANELLDMRAVSNGLENCAYLPVLTADCTWSPPLNPDQIGEDDVHELSFSRCEEIVVTDVGFGRYCATWEDGSSIGIYWSLPGGAGQFPSSCIIPTEAGVYCATSGLPDCDVTECLEFCPPQDFDDLFHVTTTLPCDGIYNGSICLRPRQGNRPITYTWGDGLQSDCFENLAPGTYCVTITDYACDFGQTEIVECITLLPSNSSIPLVVVPEVTPSCVGASDGQICLEVSGGYPGRYQYSWSNGSISQCLVGLAGGTCYEVTITDECGQSLTQCIEVPEVTSSPPYLGINSEAWTCPGPVGGGGMIELDFYGNLPPYSFNWESGNTTWFSTSPSLPGPNPGTYSLTVTDRCGVEYDLGEVSAEVAHHQALHHALDQQPQFSIDASHASQRI